MFSRWFHNPMIIPTFIISQFSEDNLSLPGCTVLFHKSVPRQADLVCLFCESGRVEVSAKILPTWEGFYFTDLNLSDCWFGFLWIWKNRSLCSNWPESGPLDDVLPPVPGELGHPPVLAQPLPQGHPASQAEEAQARQQADTPLHSCTWDVSFERCLTSYSHSEAANMAECM